MIVARIKCPDRSEKIKMVIGSKKGNFEWGGTQYQVKPDMCYKGRLFDLLTVYTLDYVRGVPEPINYFIAEDDADAKKSRFTPNMVAEMLFRLRRKVKEQEYQWYITLGMLGGIVLLLFKVYELI